MKYFGLVLVVAVLGGSAAAADGQEARVIVSGLRVPDRVEAGQSYEVVFEGIEVTDPRLELRVACFTWQTARWSDGPYCLQAEASGERVIARLRTRNPFPYTLWGYLIYTRDGSQIKSNQVRTPLLVR